MRKPLRMKNRSIPKNTVIDASAQRTGMWMPASSV